MTVKIELTQHNNNINKWKLESTHYTKTDFGAVVVVEFVEPKYVDVITWGDGDEDNTMEINLYNDPPYDETHINGDEFGEIIISGLDEKLINDAIPFTDTTEYTLYIFIVYLDKINEWMSD